MEPAGSPGLRPSLPEWAIVSSARREHIERVAELAGRWAMEMGVPDSERHRWLRAVWLHDALRDAPEEELLRWAPSTPGPPELRHGPASAARAKSKGRPTAACWTPCAITRSVSPSGTWSGGFSTAPTTWSPAARTSASGAPTSPSASPPSRRTCSATWRGRGSPT